MTDYQKITEKQLGERFRGVNFLHLDENMTVIAAADPDNIGKSFDEIFGTEAPEKLKALCDGEKTAVFDVGLKGENRKVAAFLHENQQGQPVFFCYIAEKPEELALACRLDSVLEFRRMLDKLELPSAIVEKGRISYCNKAFSAATGYPPAVLYSMKLSNLVSKNDKMAVLDAENGKLPDRPLDITLKNAATGSRAATLYTGASEGQLLAVITDRESQNRREHLLTMLSSALSDVNEALCILEAGGKIFWSNTPFRQSFGENTDFSGLLPESSFIKRCIRSMGEQQRETEICRLKRANGSEFYSEISVRALGDGFIFAEIKDITDSMDKAKLLDDYKTTDYPTGVSNSVYFRDCLTAAMDEAKATSGTLNLIMFSMVNYSDLFFEAGSKTADVLLKTTAQRAKGFLPEGCKLGRLGESRFGIFFEAPKGKAINLMRDFMAYMDVSTVDGGNTYYSKIYAGVCSYPEDAGSVQALYSGAKNAMHRASSSYSSPAYGFYGNDGSLETLRCKSSFEHNVEKAAKDNDFYMEYQPINELSSGQTVMLAALLRTRSPMLRDMVSGDFLMAAEATGAMVPIGFGALEQVAEYLQERSKKGLKFLPITFNLSFCQLIDNGLIPFCEKVFEKYELPRDAILFRISADKLRWQRYQCIEAVNSLCDYGFSICIDHFSDRDCTFALPEMLPSGAVAAYTIGSGVSSQAVSTAHAAGMKIIAVGAETEAQLSAVKSAGFDYCQGFAFSRSLSKEQLEV